MDVKDTPTPKDEGQVVDADIGLTGENVAKAIKGIERALAPLSPAGKYRVLRAAQILLDLEPVVPSASERGRRAY